MNNFAFTKPNFSTDDLNRVDPRIRKFINGWTIDEVYENRTVRIPDYVPMNYYEVNNHPSGVAELERQLTIWCGWAGRSDGKTIDGLYDAEVIITIGVNAQDVLTTLPCKVNAQLMKSGGSPINVYYNNKLVTDFTQNIQCLWWSQKVPNGYVAIDDLNKFL